MDLVAMGAHKDAKVYSISCGAPDCEKDHKTYDCKDVVVLTEGMLLEEAKMFDVLDESNAKGLTYQSSTRVYPTVLGLWFEGICEN